MLRHHRPYEPLGDQGHASVGDVGGAVLSEAEGEAKASLEGLGVPSSKAEVVALSGVKAGEVEALGKTKALELYDATKERAEKAGVDLAKGLSGLDDAQMRQVRKSAEAALSTVRAVVDLVNRKQKTLAWKGASWDWSGTEGGSIASLEAALMQNAEMADDIREAQEQEIHEGYASMGDLGGSLAGPYGPIVKGFFGVIDEGIRKLNKVIFAAGPDAKTEYDDAAHFWKEIWKQWHLVPEPFDGVGFETGEDYKDISHFVWNSMQATETEPPPWQERWNALAEWALFTPAPAARDLIRLGWFPFTFSSFAGGPLQYYDRTLGGGKAMDDRGFATLYQTTPAPDPTYLELALRQGLDRFAATIGTLIATKEEVPGPPVIAAAVESARRWRQDPRTPPGAYHAAWRFKFMFLDAYAVADALKAGIPIGVPGGFMVTGKPSSAPSLGDALGGFMVKL
jgi:hypothetical protein